MQAKIQGMHDGGCINLGGACGHIKATNFHIKGTYFHIKRNSVRPTCLTYSTGESSVKRSTVIRSLLKIFCLAQNDIFFANFFTSNTEYIACIDMNENIATKKISNTKFLQRN